MFDKIFEVKMPIVDQTTMLMCDNVRECMYIYKDYKEVWAREFAGEI
jgi:hypothetical protein